MMEVNMSRQTDQDWRAQVLAMAEGATGFQPAPLVTTVAPTPLPGGVHTVPSFDVIERLPEERKDLLRKLRQHRSDKYALTVPSEDVRQQSMRKIEAANTLKRLVAHPSENGFGLPETDRRVDEATKALEKETADHKRLQELQEVRSAAWQAAGAALQNVEDWLRHNVPSNCRIEAVETEAKLLKGENLLDGVARFQRRGRELKAVIHAIRSACFPKDYCKRRALEMVEALEQRGAISVSRLVELDGDIEFPSLQQRAMVHNATPGAVAYHEAVDVAALLAFLVKPTVISALDRLIDDEADDESALTHEQRQQRESEAQADLLDIERQEAELTWQAMSQNLPVEFRPDCDPRAILQIQLITTPRADALPATSPGHSWPWSR
jgi:hypothetical protein